MPTCVNINITFTNFIIQLKRQKMIYHYRRYWRWDSVHHHFFSPRKKCKVWIDSVWKYAKNIEEPRVGNVQCLHVRCDVWKSGGNLELETPLFIPFCTCDVKCIPSWWTNKMVAVTHKETGNQISHRISSWYLCTVLTIQ